MNILDRYNKARNKFVVLQESRRTKKMTRLDKKAEVLEKEVKVEKLKTKKSVAKSKRKKLSNVANRITQNNKTSDKPYWLEEKPKKPSWL